MKHRRGYSLPEIVSEEVFVAGQRVAPGCYRMLDSERAVRLDHEDILPASCDGHVATYVRDAITWSEVVFRKREVAPSA